MKDLQNSENALILIQLTNNKQLFKNFIIAFKQTYKEIYRDKIAAKKYLKYLREEITELGNSIDKLNTINEDIDYASYSSIVPSTSYCEYFLRLHYFLQYDMHVTDNKPFAYNHNSIGYLKILKNLYTNDVRHYNGARLMYHMNKYKECLQEIKETVKWYNEEWKKLDSNHTNISTENWDNNI